MALATGFSHFEERLSKLRVSSAVRQQRIRHKISLVNRRVAHLAGAIGPKSQAFEGTINVVEGRFNRGDAFVAELWHVDQPS